MKVFSRTKPSRGYLVLPVLCLFGFIDFSCTKDELPLAPVDECDTLEVTYDSHIKLIIDQTCATTGCHESGAGFGDFSAYDGIKAKVDDGKVYNRVFDQMDMPQAGSPDLDSCERVLINAWINLGAPEN